MLQSPSCKLSFSLRRATALPRRVWSTSSRRDNSSYSCPQSCRTSKESSQKGPTPPPAYNNKNHNNDSQAASTSNPQSGPGTMAARVCHKPQELNRHCLSVDRMLFQRNNSKATETPTLEPLHPMMGSSAAAVCCTRRRLQMLPLRLSPAVQRYELQRVNQPQLPV